MGQAFKFVCPDCKYSSTVSGGRDFGMLAVVRTMVCEDCREVVDVLIGRYSEDGPTGDPEYDRDLNLCPECQGKNVRPWSKKHTCPRCDSEMVQDEDSHIMWD